MDAAARTAKEAAANALEMEAKKNFITSVPGLAKVFGKGFAGEAWIEFTQPYVNRTRRFVQSGGEEFYSKAENLWEDDETWQDALWQSVTEGMAAGFSSGVHNTMRAARTVPRNRAMAANARGKARLLADSVQALSPSPDGGELHAQIQNAHAYDMVLVAHNIGLQSANVEIEEGLQTLRRKAAAARELGADGDVNFVALSGRIKELEAQHAQSAQTISRGDAALGAAGKAVKLALENTFAPDGYSSLSPMASVGAFNLQAMEASRKEALRVLGEGENGSGIVDVYTDPGTGITVSQDRDTGVARVDNASGLLLPRDFNGAYPPTVSADAALRNALDEAVLLAKFNTEQKKANGIRHDAVQSLVEKLGVKHPVQLVENVFDPNLPQKILAMEGFWDGAVHDDGTIYVNLNRMRTPADVLAALAHEEFHNDFTAFMNVRSKVIP